MQNSSKSNNVVNLGKIGDARLDLVPKLEECRPGLEPTEYNIVLAPAVMPERVGSILLSDQERERLGMAMQVGRIVAASPVAFNYERWPIDTYPPQVGDVVWFARYAGGVFEGRDGREYRIVKDKDIGAIIPEEEQL
jgi:co-chaperonin GroES (HSP10)